MPKKPDQPDDRLPPDLNAEAARLLARHNRELHELLAKLLPQPAEEVFIPNAFQRGILEALNHKAMRTDPLGAAVGDRSRLFKEGGLPELVEQGLVDHHRRIGYYRPDAPPPEWQSELKGD